jgi:hypothetical protein
MNLMPNERSDELQDYLDKLRVWAQLAIERRSEWHILFEFLENELGSGNLELRSVINWREAQMTNQDHTTAAAFLGTGFFAPEIPAFRAAAFVVALEIDRQRTNQELSRALERYRPENDPVFSSAAGLEAEVNKRKTMVSMANLRQDSRSSAFIFESDDSTDGGTKVKLTSLINPELINFVRTHSAGRSEVEIRLDPDYPSPSADPPFATYTPELPPHFPAVLAGVSFGQFLQTKQWNVAMPDCANADARLAAEYFSGGLRALETTGFRNGDRAEVYFEELVDQSTVYIDDHDDTLKMRSDGPVIGRMIHCDTDATNQTPCEDVVLYHLDLAVNVYEGVTGGERLTTPLPKRVEASNRIHLFKGAPLPLNLLPGIAYLFFRSHRLLYQALPELRHPGEHAQAIAAHENPRTTKLYDRTSDEITLDEIERIGI